LGESQEIKIKVRIDQHGIVLISNAIMIEKKEAVENDNPVNEQENTTGNKNEQQPDQTNAPAGENMETGPEVNIYFIFIFWGYLTNILKLYWIVWLIFVVYWLLIFCISIYFILFFFLLIFN